MGLIDTLTCCFTCVDANVLIYALEGSAAYDASFRLNTKPQIRTYATPILQGGDAFLTNDARIRPSLDLEVLNLPDLLRA